MLAARQLILDARIQVRTYTTLNAGRATEESPKATHLLFDTMRYVEHSTVATEEDSLKDVDPSNPEFVDLGDTTKKNKWGNNAYHLSSIATPHL
jgi:hypothetical protein